MLKIRRQICWRRQFRLADDDKMPAGAARMVGKRYALAGIMDGIGAFGVAKNALGADCGREWGDCGDGSGR